MYNISTHTTYPYDVFLSMTGWTINIFSEPGRVYNDSIFIVEVDERNIGTGYSLEKAKRLIKWDLDCLSYRRGNKFKNNTIRLLNISIWFIVLCSNQSKLCLCHLFSKAIGNYWNNSPGERWGGALQGCVVQGLAHYFNSQAYHIWVPLFLIYQNKYTFSWSWYALHHPTCSQTIIALFPFLNFIFSCNILKVIITL